jgi:hypothetical protein
MKNGLLTPSIKAICQAGGESMHGRYKLPSRAKNISRRRMRKTLEKQGIQKEQALKMLVAMGYPEPVRRAK